MRAKVYIETSIISYLTARPSRDLMAAAAQQATREWWENQREHFALYVSPLVLEEAAVGDANAAAKRLETLQNIPLLEITLEVLNLAKALVAQKAMPMKARDDATHIATATIHHLNYLLTWNCKHLANAQMQEKLVAVSSTLGYHLPRICTPYELIGEPNDVQ